MLTLLLAVRFPVTEDFEKGKEIAKAHHRPMVLLFTGSDWCVWSKKLLHDVLDNPEFRKTVGNHFVFVKIDFPEANHQKTALLQEHYELKEHFHVHDFPAVILLDPDGFEISRLGYIPHDPGEYGALLLSTYLEYQELYQSIRSTNLAVKNLGELEKLYQKASVLHSPHLMQTVLNEGASRSEGVFFPLEKYNYLFRIGKRSSSEAKLLREAVMKRDPENQHGGLLRLALLDFQANVEEGIKTPEEAALPLQEFISRFGDKDKETLLKLHHMISDYFRSHVIAKK